MHTTKHIKQSILMLSFATLVAGCGGGSTTTSTGTTASTSTPTTAPTATAPTATAPTATPTTVSAAKAVQNGQLTDSVTGEPLANVEVSIGSHTTTTDAQGFYELTDITVSDRAVVTFKHEGYYKNSKIISIKQYSDGTTLSPNYLEFALVKYDGESTDDSQNLKHWTHLSPTGAAVKVPGGIYMDSDGNAYNGNVTGYVVYKDTTTDKGRDALPGAYEGKNSNGIIVPFSSNGFIVVDLKDDNGNALSITDNITLTFPATGTTEENIPLWYYSDTQGMWVEEGYATRQEDGKYQGDVSHPGIWSLSQPIEDASATYINRIVYPDGTPVKNLRVYAVGKNWIRTDLSTDENGVLEIEVIPGEEFALKVYHYGDKYGAKFNGIIPAIASGEIVDNIE